MLPRSSSILQEQNSYGHWKPKLRTAFKQRQLANNQTWNLRLRVYLLQKWLIVMAKPCLIELKQAPENIDYVVDESWKHRKIRVMKPQGTYLWLDFQPILKGWWAACYIHDQAKLILNCGTDLEKKETYMPASMWQLLSHPHWRNTKRLVEILSPNKCWLSVSEGVQ